MHHYLDHFPFLIQQQALVEYPLLMHHYLDHFPFLIQQQALVEYPLLMDPLDQLNLIHQQLAFFR